MAIDTILRLKQNIFTILYEWIKDRNLRLEISEEITLAEELTNEIISEIKKEVFS